MGAVFHITWVLEDKQAQRAVGQGQVSGTGRLGDIVKPGEEIWVSSTVLHEVRAVVPTGANGDAFVELQGSLETAERAPGLVKVPASWTCPSQQG